VNRAEILNRTDAILVTGYAQSPKGTTLHEHFKVFGTVLVLEPISGEILDASFTFVSPLTHDFMVSVVRGYKLMNGLEPLLAEIERRTLMPSQGAIIQSLKACHDRWRETFHNRGVATAMLARK
jgi:hypothetical protein